MTTHTLSTRSLDIPASLGAIDAKLFLPDVAGRAPAIVLLSDIRGARPVYESLASAFASAGYAVLLPNIYYRSARAPVVVADAPFDDDARARVQGYRSLLSPEAQGEDFSTLVSALDVEEAVDASRIGVVGYCLTGSFALRFAAQFPDRVRAAASLHGGQLAATDDPASPALLADKIKARVYVGHADADASAPPEQIARLDRALAEGGVAFTTEFYAGARHGFAIKDSVAYDETASLRHLRRLLMLFEETLCGDEAR